MKPGKKATPAEAPSKALPLLVQSVRVLAAVGGLAMASTGECEPVFLIVFLAFFLLGLRIEKLPVLAKLLSLLQPVMAWLVFGLALIDFFYLSKSFLLSVAHFLLCLQALQLLVLRTNRENLGGILVSSLMMLSASTLAVEWTYFVLLTYYLLLVIWALVLHNLSFEADQLRKDKNEEQILSADFQLTPVLKRTLRHATVLAFSVAVFCCAVVFVAFPRFNFQGFRGQYLQPVHKSGFTSQVELGNEGRISVDDTVVMRVEIDPKERSKWTGYIWGASLEEFDGRVWRRPLVRPERIYSNGRGDVYLPVARTFFRGEPLHQNVYLESIDSPILFSAGRPTRITIDRVFLEMNADGSVQRPFNDAWRVHYEVDAHVMRWPDTWEVDSVPLKRSIPIKRSPELGQIYDLALSVAGNAKDDYAAASRILSHLQSRCSYTLQLAPVGKDENPVKKFLFESKAGHCEYFASAMCLMMRMLGVRSRVATGFVSGEWNERGGYYIVRSKDAHAWAEIYIEPLGWVSFDPSPREVGGSVDTSKYVRKWREFMDYLNLRWNRYILSYDLQRQLDLVKNIVQQSNRMSHRFENWMWRVKRIFSWKWFTDARERLRSKGPIETKAPMIKNLFIVGGAAAAAFLLWGLIKGRQKEAIWFYRPFVRRLERKLGAKMPSQTLREFSTQKTTSSPQPWSDAVRFLEGEYYRLRFDPSAQLTPSQENDIKSALESLK